MSSMSLPKRGISPFIAGATALGVLFGGWLLIARNGQIAAGSQDSSSLKSNDVTVTREAGYQQAQSLFRKHNYPAAISALDALGASPARTNADRFFLSRQRDICLKAASAVTMAAAATSDDTLAGSVTAKQNTGNVDGAKSTDSIDGDGAADCGPRALLLLCQNAKLPATLPVLRKTANVTAPRGASLDGLSRAARSVGFSPFAVQMDRDALANLSTPAIAWVDGNHYVAVYEVRRSLRGIAYDSILIQDPNKTGKETILLNDLLSRSGGVLLTLPVRPGAGKA